MKPILPISLLFSLLSLTGHAEPVKTGEGEFVFEVVDGWGVLDGNSPIGPTHGGVAVDKAGQTYVSTDAGHGILVYGADGKLVKSIAKEFSGTHSLMIREENGEEFLYGAWLRGAQAVKLKLDGTPVLTIGVPMESGLYPEPGQYKPTGLAVGPDGAIFVSDGYGKNFIHKFDAAGKYIKSFGGKGAEDGKFNTCHGLGIDNRGEKPLLLVCDRANRRLQQYDFEGNFVATIATNLRLPCAVSVNGPYIAIAELEARVTILDKDNKEISHPGDNPDKGQWAKHPVPPAEWKVGFFTAPHGLSWDNDGNLIVQDWNATGRVTKLVRVK